MEERIVLKEEIAVLVMFQLSKCENRDHAFEVLDNFVLRLAEDNGGELLGELYDPETNTYKANIQHRLSNNTSDVKRRIIDYLREVYERAEIFADETLDRLDDEIKREDFRFVTKMRLDRKFAIKMQDWIVEWSKRPAPIIKEEKTARLRPTELGKKCVPLMYEQLIKIERIDANVQSWNYVCGLTDETSSVKPIRWLGDKFALKVLIDNFFNKALYFDRERGAINFLYSCLADKDGNAINQSSVKTIINNSIYKNAKETSKRIDEEWRIMQPITMM